MCEYIIAEDFNMDKHIFDEGNSLWYEHKGWGDHVRTMQLETVENTGLLVARRFSGYVYVRTTC